ncbi:hypothetical protein F4861DRAFT_540414 [Xylaria intraflava]|nr:hypothetical protein F4861DRAFT_540414 [Xylaria intraflava]
MDPISAVAVAAAAIQFLDASIKACNAFQEIRHSAKSATEGNEQLEDDIRSAQRLRASLLSTSGSQEATDPVSELTTRCTSKADELLALLEYVRGSGESLSSAHVFVRVVRKQRAIKELYNALKTHQDNLNQMISEKLLPSFDLIKVQQSKEFANLNSLGQELINRQIEERKIHENRHVIVTEKLDGIRSDMQLRVEEDNRSRMRDKFLESLWFPEIDQRQNEIKEPAPQTLNWLFRESDEVRYPGANQPTWSNFRRWLREDTSLYWISGKAGSGKSTLMAHIINDARTRKDLITWGDGRNLEVLSFFFWRAGSRIQNSVLGLLRSLLFQLCKPRPDIVNTFLARLSSPTGNIPNWTERELLNHAVKAIESCNGTRFCIFIDGLDEYTGRYHHVIDYINKLKGFGNTKFCISSRPEVEIANRFRGLKQLRLQDLNRDDIREFVIQCLSKTQLTKDFQEGLSHHIVKRAEGVFLWASLVTQSLVRGTEACDNQEIMRKRLDSLPKDMNQLFERMLSGIDPVYRDSLAFYVELMKIGTDFSGDISLRIYHPLSIPVITVAQLKDPIHSYEEFAKECERTEIRITTQSAGLLEITNYLQPGFARENWESAEDKFVSSQPHFMWKPDNLNVSRLKCPANKPYPLMLNYENRQMKWIHRSAFEFFNQDTKNPLLECSSSHGELLQRICESCISYSIDAPSYVPCVAKQRPGVLPPVVFRLICLVDAISWQYDDHHPTTATALLDSVYSVFSQIHPDEFSTAEHLVYPRLDTGMHPATFLFWSQCSLSHKLWPYTLSRMTRILSETRCDDLIVRILLAGLLHVRIGYHVPVAALDFGSFLENFVEILYQNMFRVFETGGPAQTTRCVRFRPNRSIPAYRWLRQFVALPMVCVTWKEPLTDRSMAATLSLLLIIIVFVVRSSSRANHLRYAVKGSIPLASLIDITDLYVAPNLGLDHIHIQISAKAFMAGFAGREDRYKGTIGSCVSAAAHHPTVRILCRSPSLETEKPIAEKDAPSFASLGDALNCSVTELEFSRLISVQLSAATSDKLLDLFGYDRGNDEYVDVEPVFGIIKNRERQRKDVCEMLLQEIRLVEQGLDESQQLIAADCIRADLLDLDVNETIWIDLPEDEG